MNLFNPDSWMDVFTIVFGVTMTTVPSWFAIKAHRTSAAVLSETKNGHTTPMRADLDRVIEAIDRMSHDITAIRHGLADEEDRRRAHVQEVHQRIDELHRRISP